MRGKFILNWWEMKDDQILHLDENILDSLDEKITKKFKSLFELSRILNIPRATLYNKFRYKNQGISVKFLKLILNKLKMPYASISKANFMGRYKGVKSVNFPLEIEPFWAELLSHMIFDGYADNYQIRYSNYNPLIRDEFIKLIKRFPFETHINNPKKIIRDIDITDVMSKLIISTFKMNDFYSKTSKLSLKFFHFVKNNFDFGWYFLKGAFMDEGSITGSQVWIVRGIRNKPLAEDIMSICNILSLNTRLRETNVNGYSIGINADSFDSFFNNVYKISLNKFEKLSKLNNIVFRHHLPVLRDDFGKFIKRGV